MKLSTGLFREYVQTCLTYAPIARTHIDTIAIILIMAARMYTNQTELTAHIASLLRKHNPTCISLVNVWTICFGQYFLFLYCCFVCVYFFVFFFWGGEVAKGCIYTALLLFLCSTHTMLFFLFGSRQHIYLIHFNANEFKF